MSAPSEECDPLGELADEFLERRRRGESPSVGEYLDRLPERREELRDLLSALLAVEHLKPDLDEEEEEPLAPSDADEDDRPDVLGDYRILREVGRGGMGVVYEAEQVSLGRRVALKVLAPWLRPGPQQVKRFLREARSAAKLHHPDIVPIIAVGEHRGRHYYAMQFISGHGLDRVLNDVRRLKSPSPRPGRDVDQDLTQAAPPTGEPGSGGTTRLHRSAESDSPTPAGLGDSTPSDAPDSGYRRSVAEIVLHAAEAIHYAHTQGMLHRDIKPSNLLLDDQGKVWVTDFGLVKAIDGQDLTNTGDIVGTLRYMAPERFRGRCDVRSDVYALGLTLYEMLALRPAYEAADRHRLIHQITQEEPKPIRRLLPTLPRDLATIVHTAIAREPEDRYATAERLAEDLRRWLRHEPIRARPSPAHERLAKWARRNPAVASLAATAALAALAALTILAYGYVRVSRALYDSQRISYFQKVALAERAWTGNDLKRADTILDEAPEEFRSWEWRYLKRLCHPDLATLTANGGEQPNALAFAPGGRVAATAGTQGNVVLWEVPSGRRLRTIFGRPEGVHGLAFRPDGAVLAAAGGVEHAARLIEVATGLELAVLPMPRGLDPLSVAYSPDGATLATAAGVFWETVVRAGADRGDLTLWDASSAKAIRTLSGHAGSVHQAVFSPDGSRLASAGGDGLVKVWDPSTGEAVLDLRGHEGVVMGVAYSPDGRRIVSAGLDGTLRIWDAATGSALATFRDRDEKFLGVAWSPDGRTIAAAGRSWVATAWDAATGRKVETYRGHGREAIGVAYTPDGRIMGSVGYDGLVRLWDARRGQTATVIADFPSAVTDVAVDPRGRWIAAASESRPLELRSLDLGEPGPKLESGPASHGSAAFSPDGSRIAAGARSGRGVVDVWDPATGGKVYAIDVGPDPATAVAYSPDGRTLAVADASGLVQLRDAATGAAVRSFPRTALPVTSLAFSPVGLRLAASTGDRKRVYVPGSAVIWELETGRVLELRGHEKGIADLAFSPDGLRLATASWDSTVGLWDVPTGGRTRSLEVGGLHLWTVAFTRDGARVIAADNIGRMTFWDVESGYELLTFAAHSDRIYDLAFDAEGGRLVSAGRDAAVKVWDGAPSAVPGRPPSR